MKYSIKYRYECGNTYISWIHASSAANARLRLLSYFVPGEIKILRVRKLWRRGL